ncbi:MAG: FeoB-associated Cys-rich membrane protein [Clostridia bacterium]|nr:FeoB-associated Cys-rich membrane protein [Clostridia bacterium]
MGTWILENLGTILVSLALACAIALIVWSIVRDKKKGKSSCGCGCASCPMSHQCHQKTK